jgi:hypothetical protein
MVAHDGCRRRVAARAASGEVSHGKTRFLPSDPAGFTCTRVRTTIGRPCPLPGYPTVPAFYPVSVRQGRLLPRASFRPRLATTPVPPAACSGRYGQERIFTSSNRAMRGAQKKSGHRWPDSGSQVFLGFTSKSPFFSSWRRMASQVGRNRCRWVILWRQTAASDSRRS